MLNRTAKFVLTSYFISWFFWGILALIAGHTGIKFGQPLFMAFFVPGGLGPTFASFIFINARADKEEFRLFKDQIFKWRINPLWYIFILIIPFILLSLPWTMNYITAGASDIFLRQSILSLLIAIPLNILFGGLEEIGWRGILLPGLMKRFSKFTATFFTSLLWSLWHLPLWFVKGSPQELMDPVFFVILGLSFSYLLTVAYTKTQSIFLCILLHSIFNSYPNLIYIPEGTLIRDSVIMLVFSIIVFFLFEYTDFRRVKDERLHSN